ncbi:MAG: DUF2238 domain-containing protein [Bacteroidota bacterium]|nr:DUF2238 domain-containing protein [Bacteroidota bacterium]MDX5430318.1 DUF2238 domain-containing protein [Bacteroidota bacterium]MDX5469079.1 DUF2238 domain-containing protein [Bacteroidota bacterium]
MSETRTPIFSTALHREQKSFVSNRWLQSYLLIFIAVWVSTLLGTSDLNNWILENVLTVISILVLIFTYKRYSFSDASYALIALFLCLHVYGSKYTYADNPLGYWIQDYFSLERNHYDRIVHCSFGLLLSYPLVELALNHWKLPKWIAYLLPVEWTLSVSALYELIEWAVADIFFQEQGVAYLGTQGDPWDAQKDIFLAVTGAAVATLALYAIRRIRNVY